MNIYQFMSDSPILTFFIAAMLITALQAVFFKLPNRYFRSRNIVKQGWPPKHCDADGDLKEEGGQS